MTAPTRPLVYRYTILRAKLQREIARLQKEIKWKENIIGVTGHEEKDKRKQLRLHRQSLRLLESVFNGEDENIT
jgi:hypothetical protein